MKDFTKFFLSALICALVALIGSVFTLQSIPNWYLYLNKPFFTPPNFIFGPVWTILYALMAVSLFLVWKKDSKNKKNTLAKRYFFIQLGFNLLWSIIFFGYHLTFLALVDIFALFISIFVVMITFYKISRTAAYILIPYFLWVGFASILNFSIYMLNG